MSFDIVCIVQARLNSTRLPRKTLLPLAGQPLLMNVLERIQRAHSIDRIVVTCPANDMKELAVVVPSGIIIDPFMGDENDLIARHLQSATLAKASIVVRVPSDNAAVDPIFIDEAIDTYLTHPFVYYSNTTARVRDIYLDGIGAEVFSRSRLQWLDRVTRGHAEWREHPHKYFEERGLLQLPKADVRLDVNTQADYEFIKDLYAQFGHNRFTTEEVVCALTTRGPHAALGGTKQDENHS